MIECRGLPSTCGDPVRACFEKTFWRYGLPWAIRNYNGPPFAGVGLGGLTRLSVWWIRLGILPERIRPGHPEENGRHERMHRTLKDATASPPKSDRWAQQTAFNVFRREFNEDRPHEALGMIVPARRYCESERPSTETPPEIKYGTGVEVRRVRSNGEIKWGGGFIYLSEALIGELVGLKPVDEDQWTIYFGPPGLPSLDFLSRRAWVHTSNVGTRPPSFAACGQSSKRPRYSDHPTILTWWPSIQIFPFPAVGSIR